MERLYEVKELVTTCRSNKAVVYRLLNDGKIRAVKMGKKWKILESEVERFLRGGGGEEKQAA
jgi:excisionase family DNA binding protein